MTFDIHQFDEPSVADDNEQLFEAYKNELQDRFIQSPEGKAHSEIYPDSGGFWARELMELGYNYVGFSLPEMTLDVVDEVITEIFPRKITIQSPDEADEVIPELEAFWTYLMREYELQNASDILKYLRKIKPTYKEIMNDPANFGMAKSFMTMALDAGVDISNEDEMNAFILAYNAALKASQPAPFVPDWSGLVDEPPVNNQANKKRKKKRKAAKVARKKQRRRR